MLGIAPGTLFIVGVSGGIGATMLYTTFQYAGKAGANLELRDLLPMPPPYLPLPRFFYTKPELLEELRRR